jgi:uroporphyrinogen-III synthase
VLVYRAQEAREVLPEMLRDAHRHVDVVAAYRTRLVDDPHLAENAEQADIVTFTSASTVEGFLQAVPHGARLLTTKTVACIGPVTAETLRSAGIRVDVVADTFTVDGLLRALGAAANV